MKNSIKKMTTVLSFIIIFCLTSCAKGFDTISESDHNENKQLTNDFSLSKIEDVQMHDTSKKYDHLIIENDSIKKLDIEKVVKFGVDFYKEDYTLFLNELGNSFLIDKYDPSKWKISETKLESNISYKTAKYDKMSFVCTNNCNLIFAEKSFTRPSFDYIGITIPIETKFYKMTDNTIIQFDDIKMDAKKLIWKFDDAIDIDRSELNEISYFPEFDEIKLDYLPSYFGLKVSRVKDITDMVPGNINSQELLESIQIGCKSVYVNSKHNMYVDINSPNIKPVTISEYDRMITLDSALDFLDNNIAKNSEYNLKNAELKYLLTKDNEAKDSLYPYVSVPVWEFILYNQKQSQAYACQINAITGDYSFVKIRGTVE